MKTVYLAGLLALAVSAPAAAYGTRDTTAHPFPLDVGREAPLAHGPGTVLPVRPAVTAREAMPVVLPGWRHDGSDLVSNGQAAYPVLTQTAADHPPSGLEEGMLLVEDFPAPQPSATSLAGQNDLGFDG